MRSDEHIIKQLIQYCLAAYFFLAACFPARGQTHTIDSLKKNIAQATGSSQKLQAIFSLCRQGYTLHTDTLMTYAMGAEQLARETGDRHAEITARYYISYALTTKGLIDSSLSLANQCLAMLAEIKRDPVLEGNLLNQKGRCFMRKNKYKEAINMGYQVISRGEEGRDAIIQMQGKTLIGWAYLEMGQPKSALQWHLGALHTTRDSATLHTYSILFANIALNYNALENLDSAFYYIEKAVQFSRNTENLFALSNSLAIRAQLLIGAGQARLAEPPLQEVVAIRKLIGDPFYIVSDMSQLSLYYAHNGQPEKGIALCREGIALARKYKLSTKLFFLYSALAENYKALGNTKQYAGILEKIISLKDSIYQVNSEEALAEMQAKYEAQKKESIIIQQQLSLVKKNYLIYGSLLLFCLATVAAFFIFYGYRKRQKLKTQILVNNEKRISRERIREAEEKERQRIAADLHDNLGVYAASMASNLDYIQPQVIQVKDTRTRDAYRALKNNSQSIISQLNDTIWVLKKDTLSLTAISDRVKVFVNRLRPSYPGITIDIDESIDHDHWLTSSQAFHLYRVVQEAVTNALKHSKGSNILVKITGNANWRITIADNGVGITGNCPSPNGGSGLANIRNRCREAGWTVEWVCNKNKGTIVIVSPAAN